ncbi:MAG: CPBP family intramembrane metalloprotease [Bradyrhizobium sp.]|uniref:CPBP family intramembrane glutamic endopeptidase n=1 Tax=Bradyrhizobium sp. TaxID=376 RepID=UPI001D23FC2B|nr:type II CAAX endopeptidase family protein [Bradyrhizobium sp.]MBV9559255.1 CPBP family intramembrane metalloprotease [Bradyrhizobium sp.]
MDSLNPESPPVSITPAQHQPRILGFWWTTLWGVVLFAAMFVGQIAVVVFFVLARGDGLDLGEAIRVVAGSGLAIALSVICGLPTTLVALWLAIRMTRTPFADYLALRWPSWKDFLIGAGGLIVLVMGWDLMSRALGRETAPDFMNDVLNSARRDGSVWMLVPAIGLAAPLSEELMARGFLYRGWSETFLGVPGAIVLSSMVWTGLHLQYDWYFFGEVFCLGLWFGYLRYRSRSLWLTIVLHGLNNLGALVETLVIAGQSQS